MRLLSREGPTQAACWLLSDQGGHALFCAAGRTSTHRACPQLDTPSALLPFSVLLLVDASIPPMPLDVSCAAWFAQAEIPFTIVFTKLDKRKKGVSGSEENIAAFEAKVEEACGYLPPTILTSSRSGKGKNELLAHVAQLRDFFNKQRHGM